jgi:hypothetical protein
MRISNKGGASRSLPKHRILEMNGRQVGSAASYFAVLPPTKEVILVPLPIGNDKRPSTPESTPSGEPVDVFSCNLFGLLSPPQKWADGLIGFS